MNPLTGIEGEIITVGFDFSSLLYGDESVNNVVSYSLVAGEDAQLLKGPTLYGAVVTAQIQPSVDTHWFAIEVETSAGNRYVGRRSVYWSESYG